MSLNDVRDRIDLKKQTLLRLLILGNAGGTIATLSFIGTLMPTDAIHAVGKGAFLILLLFVIGLACGWLARIADWNIARIEYDSIYEPIGEAEDVYQAYERRRLRWEKVISSSINIMFLMLGTGTIIGLIKLYELIG